MALTHSFFLLLLSEKGKNLNNSSTNENIEIGFCSELKERMVRLSFGLKLYLEVIGTP